MRVQTVLTGTSALVMHNAQLANPDNEWSKEVAKITSKRRKTEDDRKAIAKLEFMGGLYVNESGPFVPTANVRRCFVEAAKARKLGRQVNRAVVVIGMTLPVLYEGPRKPDELYADPKFQYLASVGVGANRVQRMRPQFPEWQLDAKWELVTDLLDFQDFQAIVAAAGLIEGLGDNRINGYGRFTATVSEVPAEEARAA